MLDISRELGMVGEVTLGEQRLRHARRVAPSRDQRRMFMDWEMMANPFVDARRLPTAA